MRHVYSAQYQIVVSGEPRAYRVPFECDFASIAELAAELADKGVVAGHRLDLVNDGRGGSMIRGRSGHALGIAGLVGLQDWRGPVWEPET